MVGLVAAVLVGCAAEPTATPLPTPLPTSTPVPTATPEPTPTMTRAEENAEVKRWLDHGARADERILSANAEIIAINQSCTSYELRGRTAFVSERHQQIVDEWDRHNYVFWNSAYEVSDHRTITESREALAADAEAWLKEVKLGCGVP